MPKTKRSARNVPALTPADALGMLASAITYMQAAGLSVKAGNDSRLGLVLAIEGARMAQDAFGVMTFAPRVASTSAEVASIASTSVTSTPTADPASIPTAECASTPQLPAHG